MIKKLFVVVLQITQVDVLVQILLKLADLLNCQTSLVRLVVMAGREKTLKCLETNENELLVLGKTDLGLEGNVALDLRH